MPAATASPFGAGASTPARAPVFGGGGGHSFGGAAPAANPSPFGGGVPPARGGGFGKAEMPLTLLNSAIVSSRRHSGERSRHYVCGIWRQVCVSL